MDVLFSLSRLTVAYPDKAAVRGIDLVVGRNEVVGVVGESGSGKTQAMLAALGLLGRSAKVGGSAKLGGVELIGAPERTLDAMRGADAAMIFQEPMSALDPLYPIGAQIAEPMIAHGRFSRAEARRRAAELVEDVRLAGGASRLRAYPHELSGGERQRVMIAMAIANEPRLVIADEPTTALDVTVEAQILDLIDALRRRLGAALVFISHDLKLVRRLADRVYVMRDGAIVESGPSGAVLTRPASAYARMLVASEPARERSPARADGGVVLSARALTVDYGGGSLFAQSTARRALDGVDLDLREGRTLGLVGESGSGKSTLARALLRLVPSKGAIRFEDRDLQGLGERSLRPLRRRMQMIFQDPFASLSPRLSVAAIVGEGLRAHEPRMSAAHPGGPLPHAGRLFRRPAPAHRHRPRAHPAPEARHPRRADLVARPPGRARHPRSPERPAGAARPRLPLHQPRSRGRARDGRRGDGDEGRPRGRARFCGGSVRPAEGGLYAHARGGGAAQGMKRRRVSPSPLPGDTIHTFYRVAAGPRVPLLHEVGKVARRAGWGMESSGPVDAGSR